MNLSDVVAHFRLLRPVGPSTVDDVREGPSSEWELFRATPLRMKLYLAVVATAALVLPWALVPPVDGTLPEWITVSVLIGVSVLNVEMSRQLTGGLASSQQPHKALSAWAFACGLLLPTPWLLVVVPVTYAHARWRGLRVPLWKWLGSGLYVVLCGYAAAWARYAFLGTESNWMTGYGAEGFRAMVAAGLVFLALETVLFAGSAVLNHAADEVWLRALLRDPTFYVTEAGVLLIGGLLSAVWTGGPWFTLMFVPVYILVQLAVLYAPLRERAAVAAELTATNAELAGKNAELEHANQFKVDLLGMLGHELGNPLTSVQGYAQIGNDAAVAGDVDAAREALVVVERNARHMRSVLLDILTHVSSEHGGLTAVPEVCRIRPRLHAAAAGARPPQPVVDCPADLTALVQPGHLDQILANLLGNADKYAGGAVTLNARTARDGRVEIAVIDRGPGVPSAFRDQLFERYSREPGTSAEVLGVGLGLFISRGLARANGGEIEYRDAIPHGAEFVVWLPAAP